MLAFNDAFCFAAERNAYIREETEACALYPPAVSTANQRMSNRTDMYVQAIKHKANEFCFGVIYIVQMIFRFHEGRYENTNSRVRIVCDFFFFFVCLHYGSHKVELLSCNNNGHRKSMIKKTYRDRA